VADVFHVLSDLVSAPGFWLHTYHAVAGVRISVYSHRQGNVSQGTVSSKSFFFLLVWCIFISHRVVYLSFVIRMTADNSDVVFPDLVLLKLQ